MVTLAIPAAPLAQLLSPWATQTSHLGTARGPLATKESQGSSFPWDQVVSLPVYTRGVWIWHCITVISFGDPMSMTPYRALLRSPGIFRPRSTSWTIGRELLDAL